LQKSGPFILKPATAAPTPGSDHYQPVANEAAQTGDTFIALSDLWGSFPNMIPNMLHLKNDLLNLELCHHTFADVP